MNEQLPNQSPEEKLKILDAFVKDVEKAPAPAVKMSEKKIVGSIEKSMEKKEIQIGRFNDITSMSMEDFINYLKRGTPSQKGIGNHMDKQYWGKIGDPKNSGVTPGFFITAIGTFKEKIEIPKLTPKEAQDFINKMMTNKKI